MQQSAGRTFHVDWVGEIGLFNAPADFRVRPHKENRKMSSIPTGTELARPFMPAKDFDLSKRFYESAWI